MDIAPYLSLGEEWGFWILYFILSSAVGYVAYRILFSALERASEYTKNTLDDHIVAAMKKPAKVLVFIIAYFVATTLVFPTASLFGISVEKLAVMFIILDIALIVDGVLCAFLEWYGKHVAPKTETRVDEDLLPLARKILRILVYIVALLVVAAQLGIEISPVLTGLGIAGLAVALALQDSLGNFFAGINISVDRPIRPGDFIALENGLSGEVKDVGWRTTKIETWDKNVVFIPNQKLAQTIITNFYAPDEQYIANFVIGVDYGSDINHVKKVLLEALNNVKERNELVVKDYEPSVSFRGFGDFAMNFKCFIKVKNYRARFKVLDDVFTEIYYLFKKENIHIPFPVRTLYIHQMPKQEVAIDNTERTDTPVEEQSEKKKKTTRKRKTRKKSEK